ncbi:MAG: ATP-dependent helicase, partial [Parachlamydiaceae bacterium]
MRDLNPEQQKAVDHLNGPLLILAGAGSGKTKVVTHRIAKLLKEGVRPESILALTFTNKAASEMRNRVQSIQNETVAISTFHSFGARFLRDWAEAAGLSRKFSIYDEDDSLKVIKTVLAELGIKEKKGDARIIKTLISEAKNELKKLDEVGDEDTDIDTLKQFDQIFNQYQAHLKIADSVDFDDLLYLPLKILKENSDILQRIRTRYRYILVDEYQDTNQAQYELIKLIASEHLNLFVVGDPDQSIYSWRGANIDNILNFEKDFPTTTTIRLEQNYRSTSRILEAANALIQNNSSRLEKNLWSDLGLGAKIRLFVGYSEKDEASFVAREIEHLKDRGIPLSQIVVF